MSHKIERVAVFCGSSPGHETMYGEQAYRLGQFLARKHVHLVYGGAGIGLMGAVASGLIDAGGHATGVLPSFLKKEIAHKKLDTLLWVDSMHERKMKMHELSDAIITLPGGYGTFEEFFEMLTWGQLGLHKKPVGLLNIGDFFNPLLEMVETMMIKGFLKKENRDMLLVHHDMEILFSQMEAYVAPRVGKWIIKE